MADALRFAHARGIVQCDVKPEDVVIGEFDEVYVIDWGSATALDGAPAPSPSSPNHVVPELHGQEPRALRATDVFGLGAALYFVLTGQRRSLERPSGHELPEELATVLDKACAAAPPDRYATVEEFAAALRAFSAHREAGTLAAAGVFLVDDELLAAIEANDPGAWLIFGEARLRLEAALEGWSECVAARDGLSRAVDAVVPWQLARDEVGAVEALLDELSDEARARWQPAARAARARIAAERADAAENDRSVSLRAGRLLSVPLLVVSALLAFSTSLFHGERALGGPALAVLAAALFALFGGAAAVFRRTLLANRASAQLVLSLVALLGVSLVHRLQSVFIGDPPAVFLRMEAAIFVGALLIVGLGIERRVAWSALPFAIAAPVIASWPDFAALAFAMGGLGAAGVCVWAFSPPSSERLP